MLGIAIFAITGMQLMSTLDGTIVIVALPRLQAELDLSDAGKSWVITAYVLTFGGLLLIGGRVGDAIGHKRAFLSGVGVFTIASLVCGLATDGITLIIARAVQGTGAAIAAPTGLALIATTYAVGHARNRAFAVSAAMQASGSVLGLVLGGALTVVSWRLAFLINVPIGIVIIWIAVTRLAETHHERLKLDVTGALLATLACTSAVLVFTQGPPRGWIDPWVIGAGVAAVVFLVAFLLVERTAEHPIVPFSVFDNRSRVMTFVSLFMAGGVMLTATVIIGLYVQDVMGYSALRAGVAFLPFAAAFGLGTLLATRTAPRHRAAVADHRVRDAGARGDAVRLDAGPLDLVLPRLRRADRGGRLRNRRDLGGPAALRGGRGRAARDRAGVGDPADGLQPRRAAGARGDPGGDHVAHAVPGRHDGTGRRHDAQPARRAGRRLHLLTAVGRRDRGGGGRRGTRNRFHRTARSRRASTPARRSRRASWRKTRCRSRSAQPADVTLGDVSVGRVKYARNGDIRLAYRVMGDGEIPVVLVPGWVSNVDLYDDPTTLYAGIAEQTQPTCRG